MLKLRVRSVSHNCYRLGCYTSPYRFTPPPPTEIDWLISMVLQGRIAKKTILLVFINNFYDWLFGIPFQPVIYCQNIWNILTLFFTLSSSYNYKHFYEVKQNNALCGDHMSVLMPETYQLLNCLSDFHESQYRTFRHCEAHLGFVDIGFVIVILYWDVQVNLHCTSHSSWPVWVKLSIHL